MLSEISIVIVIIFFILLLGLTLLYWKNALKLIDVILNFLGIQSVPQTEKPVKKERNIIISNTLKINLSNKNLTKFPSEISKCQSLEELYLNDNNISGSISAEIGSLTNLKILNLSKNNIASIPPQIGKLKNLISFNISFNKLDFLPKEFVNLTNLKYLSLAGNKFKKFPPHLLELLELQVLDFSDNKLEKLPDDLSNFKNLRLFNLTLNNFTEKEKIRIKTILSETDVNF